MNRPSSFVIPTASALSVLTTAAGCADPAVGTWDLAKIDYSGYVYDFPAVEVARVAASTPAGPRKLKCVMASRIPPQPQCRAW